MRSIHELEIYHNVEIKSATEADDPLVRNIQLSIAESFSRQLAERITDSLTSNAKRLKELDKENCELKKMLAESMLKIRVLEEVNSKKW